uniref:Uncharacterized protein n=1 Tax=Anguilla anguilla TaxID=7936 RepID=A0A0E9UND4_ANGAN
MQGGYQTGTRSSASV